MRAFVASGDAAAEAVVRGHLARITAEIAPLPGLGSLHLMGSFGRGEGTATVDAQGRVRLLSDYELAAVAPRLDRPLRRALSEAQRRLAAALGVDLSVALFTERRLRLRLRRNLSFGRQPLSIVLYDLAQGSARLWGEGPAWGAMDAREIPAWEGLRLLLNRMAEALEHAAWEDSPEARYRRDKCLIAVGDAAVVLAGRYHTRYGERRARLAREAETAGWLEGEARAQVLAAYARKLGQEAGETPDFGQVQAVVLRALAEVSRRAIGLPVGELTTFAADYPRVMHDRPEGDLYRFGACAPAPLQNAILLGRRGLSCRPPPALLLHPGSKWFHAVHASVPRCFAAAPPLGMALASGEILGLARGPTPDLRFNAARSGLVALWHALCQ